MEIEIENGRIVRADITFERGFILTCNIEFEFDGSGQAIGGYSLGGDPFADTRLSKHHQQRNIAADFIGGMMSVADVDAFSALVGKIVRIKREGSLGPIVAVGHPIKDKWYCPKERLATLTMSEAMEWISEHDHLVQIMQFDLEEGWCRDVSEDMARAWMMRNGASEVIPAFVETHALSECRPEVHARSDYAEHNTNFAASRGV